VCTSSDIERSGRPFEIILLQRVRTCEGIRPSSGIQLTLRTKNLPSESRSESARPASRSQPRDSTTLLFLEATMNEAARADDVFWPASLPSAAFVSPSYDSANASAIETSSVLARLRAASRTFTACALSGRANSIRAHHASAHAFTVGDVAASSPSQQIAR
jgi:hypothetical protein